MVVYVKPGGNEDIRPPRAVSRNPIRKIGLIGSHRGSLLACPWDDPSWELWGHGSSRGFYNRELDCYFDLHGKERWERGGKKGATYPQWLKRNTVLIYMQERLPDKAPASRRYPKERILQEFNVADNRTYFPNQVAWMIALALTEGVTTIGLFGISFASRGEYAVQRGGAEFWLGYAAGRGVQIVLPKACSLLAEPKALYGYESHDKEGRLIEEYQEKKFKAHETIRPLKPGEKVDRAKPPEHLIAEIEQEERENPRPDWAKIPDDGVSTPHMKAV